MGARFEGGDHLPITVHGAQLGGIRHVNVPASAQVKSALLLAAAASGVAGRSRSSSLGAVEALGTVTELGEWASAARARVGGRGVGAGAEEREGGSRPSTATGYYTPASGVGTGSGSGSGSRTGTGTTDSGRVVVSEVGEIAQRESVYFSATSGSGSTAGSAGASAGAGAGGLGGTASSSNTFGVRS